MQESAKTGVHTNVKHWHPFGSPVYVLESAVQNKGYLVSGKPKQTLEYTLVNHPTTAEMLRLSSTDKPDW
jgi:hypothetical protein